MQNWIPWFTETKKAIPYGGLLASHLLIVGETEPDNAESQLVGNNKSSALKEASKKAVTSEGQWPLPFLLKAEGFLKIAY